MENHPHPEIKDWGRKEFMIFGAIVVFGMILPVTLKLLFFF